jgi:hypothetical protein
MSNVVNLSTHPAFTLKCGHDREGGTLRVSFQIAATGPVMFDFERIAYPAFVNVGFDAYMRFEDAIEDPETLEGLETAFGKQLGAHIDYHRSNAPTVADAEMLAALVWYLAALHRKLDNRSATEDVESLLGKEPAPREPGPIFTRLEVLGLLAAAGDELTTWKNGYGVRYLPVAQVTAKDL